MSPESLQKLLGESIMDDDTDLLTYGTYDDGGAWRFQVFDDENIVIKDSGSRYDSEDQAASEARQWIDESGWVKGGH